MKLKLFIFLFIILLPLTSAQLDIIKENYIPGETLQADIETEDFSISKLELKDNESKISVGFLSFKKSETSHQIYFDLPLNLNGTYYLTYENLNDTFTTTNGTPLAISPPIVKLNPSESSFKIKLTNKGTETIEVQASSTNPNINPARDSITLIPEESKNLFINYQSIEQSTLTLTYNARVYTVELIVEKEEIIEESETLRENALILTDSNPITHSISSTQIVAGEIEFTNILNTSIHGITFHPSIEISDIIDFNTTTFPELKPNEIKKQFIWINKNKNSKPGNYKGTLLIKSSEGDKAELQFDVTISEAEEVIEETEVIDISEETNEEQTFTVTEVSENESFIKIVEDGEGEVSPNRTIGIILLIVIVIIAGIIIWRLRPKERKIKFKDYIHPLKKGYKKK